LLSQSRRIRRRSRSGWQGSRSGRGEKKREVDIKKEEKRMEDWE
jgi:hypothetical protein